MGQERESADAGSKRAGRAMRLDSLDEAFDRYRTPAANRALIRAVYENTDAAGLVGYTGYFRIERRGGWPALEVHPGYTNGFRSELDAMRRAGDAPRWPSKRFHGAWGVDHPDDAPVRAAAAKRTAAPRRQSAPEKPAAVCPSCFLELPASGVCPMCD